jgi:hypothetical protein
MLMILIRDFGSSTIWRNPSRSFLARPTRYFFRLRDEQSQ